MPVEIVTKEDLDQLQSNLIAALEEIKSVPGRRKWMNILQATDYIGRKHTRYLAEKARNHEITVHRDGKEVFFLVDDLDRLMMQFRIPSNDEIKSNAFVRK